MKRSIILLIAIAACGGRIEAESGAAMGVAPNPCGAPAFGPGECVEETLNDGGGPDDHRRVCMVGGDTWVLYPSGEQWWWRERDSGSPEVLCHAASDGGILWPVGGTG